LFLFLEYRAQPQSTPGCEYKFGIYEDSAECSTSYIKCEYGIPNQFPCTKGLVYDEKIHGCNWPDLLLEKCDPEAVIGFKCPAKVDPKSPAARFWPFPRFAVPGDPHSLFLCTDGHPRIIACGEEKFFDQNTLTCEDIE
jgi:Chitin binding Peritrophin-A domain